MTDFTKSFNAVEEKLNAKFLHGLEFHIIYHVVCVISISPVAYTNISAIQNIEIIQENLELFP
jgi:hypothetical protein